MAAIAFPVPAEIDALADSVERFLKTEVFPRHQRDHRLLSEPRLTYAEDGRYAPAVVQHIREVRMAAAEAGYYSMSVPTALGGAGLGMLAYFVVWERIYRLCGSHHWLGAYTVSHWAFGPSAVLLQTTEEAQGNSGSRWAGEPRSCRSSARPRSSRSAPACNRPRNRPARSPRSSLTSDF